MKQIVVISGKGGTGKTTLTSSLVHLAKNRHIADCDVEAPNLSLMLESETINKELYIGGKVAKVDENKCASCGLCKKTCRFDAITEDFKVDPLKCEGCGACEYVCPHDAITMIDDETGHIFTSKTDGGIFSHAELAIGADGAGKVVTEIRKAVAQRADKDDLVIIDGSPGIGCVVIASLTGCDMAVVVTEPTQSGLSDLKRVLSLVEHFNMKAYIVINKYDINEEKTKEIEEYCSENGFEVIGKVPFDSSVNKAIKVNKPVVTFEDSDAGEEIKNVWNILNEKIRR
ncbi:ATP-binding protein [Caldisalinibacter kiritimatiensis]|uniref:Cobyrinic acid a,c-diamide synthase n=1 Tax=Caldisalinibacter kiritimatiensis TaxID=1304284 RepID=R1CGA7_9FIRM|nr:ATP-binding protein [Caldisalinibacter kiritimatiensis]EOD01355.1 Cobyrinic acid a,c-diamide synthase [Caldisalinibacter kiritimatiensis]